MVTLVAVPMLRSRHIDEKNEFAIYKDSKNKNGQKIVLDELWVTMIKRGIGESEPMKKGGYSNLIAGKLAKGLITDILISTARRVIK